MIGVDIVRISRFQRFSNLEKYIKRFNVDGNTAISAAKHWACLEALVKAKGGPFAYGKIQIKFPKNSRPQIIDSEGVLKHNYVLSLSHEDDIVIAVAFRDTNL